MAQSCTNLSTPSPFLEHDCISLNTSSTFLKQESCSLSINAKSSLHNMTVKGGTTPACAACKYQRRRCSPNCPLAPYFPANQPKMFQNVHRLFGVSNVTKTLKDLKTKDQKEDAMKSIIYEAEMRERFPVYGCSVIICQLRMQMQYAQEELNYVKAHLDACRKQHGSEHKIEKQQPYDCLVGPTQSEFESSLTNDIVFHKPPVGFGSDMTCAFNQLSLNEDFYDHGSPVDDNMARPFFGFDHCSDFNSNNNNNNLAAIQAQMDAFGIQQERSDLSSHDFQGMQFNGSTIDDDRQSYIETKDAFESSSESSLKDTTQPMEHICQRELKTAAAGFTLTTVH